MLALGEGCKSVGIGVTQTEVAMQRGVDGSEVEIEIEIEIEISARIRARVDRSAWPYCGAVQKN